MITRRDYGRVGVACLWVGCMMTSALGDVVTLRNGTNLQGIILSTSPSYLYLKTQEGSYRTVERSTVTTFEWRGLIEAGSEIPTVRAEPKAAMAGAGLRVDRVQTQALPSESNPQLASLAGQMIEDPNWVGGPIERTPLMVKSARRMLPGDDGIVRSWNSAPVKSSGGVAKSTSSSSSGKSSHATSTPRPSRESSHSARSSSHSSSHSSGRSRGGR